MTDRTSAVLLLAVAALVAAPRARAQTAEQVRRYEASVGVEEKLGAAVPRDAVLEDSEGRPLALSALGGRPLLLSFNYTGCPRLCSVQLAGLARGLKDLGWTGDGFAIATVSIDPADGPAQLHRYKETYVGQAGGGEALARAWHFLHGKQADVDALAQAVGFKYRYEPRTGEFAHQATLVVLTPDGHVSGYLHGVTYPGDALRTVVERAGANRVATLAEQKGLGGFLLTCMGLDPGDPLPLALKIMRLAGVVVAAFLFTFLGVQMRKGARRPQPPPDSPSPSHSRTS
jgi:protein SCO1/2